jgi:hypothetical protein
VITRPDRSKAAPNALKGLLLVAAICCLLVGCGGTAKNTVQTYTPPVVPTRYSQVLPKGMKSAAASRTLCWNFHRIISNWQGIATRRGKMAAALIANPLAAYKAVWPQDVRWVRETTVPNLIQGLSRATHKKLVALAGHDRRYVNQQMTSHFESASIGTCHEAASYQRARRSLVRLDAASHRVVRVANHEKVVLAAQARAAAAARRRARIAAANAWHAGYSGPVYTENGDVYYKWRDDLGCADYATDGCARMEVVAANGCSSLFVQSNESSTQNGPIIGNGIDSQDNVPPHQPVLLELDADTSGVNWWSGPQITCYP